MSQNGALSRIKDQEIPDYYTDYYSQLSEKTYDIFEKAANAKSTLVDSSGMIEPKIAFDLADRVAKMHDIEIADQLRDLLKTHGKDLVKAGADALVIGTFLEKGGSLKKLEQIAKAIQSTKR